jgi:hypothetical protein
VAALHRAVPLVQVEHSTVGVGEHLHLDVPPGRYELLEQQRVVTNAPIASRRAAASAAGRSAAECTMCMPLPPPPAAGLTSTGNRDGVPS